MQLFKYKSVLFRSFPSKQSKIASFIRFYSLGGTQTNTKTSQTIWMLILGSASETLGNAFSLQALSIISNPEATVSAFLMLFLKRHRRDYGLLLKSTCSVLKLMWQWPDSQAHTYLEGTKTKFPWQLYGYFGQCYSIPNSDIPFLSNSNICFFFFFFHFNISGIGIYLLINGLS